jgi:hypothetical protein
MAREWTDEQRTAQAERIRLWKPWRYSTGPRTPAGKRKVAKNRIRQLGSRAKLWEKLLRAVNRSGGPRTPEGKARALQNLKQYRETQTASIVSANTDDGSSKTTQNIVPD